MSIDKTAQQSHFALILQYKVKKSIEKTKHVPVYTQYVQKTYIVYT